MAAARHGVPDTVLHFGLTPGDDLLCTAVSRELRNRGFKNIWMVSKYPELFEGMNDASRIVPGDQAAKLSAFYGPRFQRLEYAKNEDDRSVPPSRHIIAELCARAGISDRVTLRPYLELSADEKSEGAWARDRIVIQSGGMGGMLPMLNKQWLPERFQQVVDALSKEFEIVQLGSAQDPLLRGARDLRSKTSIRQSAAILHHASLYVGTVGFLMHLARAAECPSVIVYGGREAPWQSGYGCNINLYTEVPCAPCWRWNTCDIDRKCMTEITAKQVIEAVVTLRSRPRNPLIEESAVI
jgi:ADP-heptose:LPS heptosyltransferase